MQECAAHQATTCLSRLHPLPLRCAAVPHAPLKPGCGRTIPPRKVCGWRLPSRTRPKQASATSRPRRKRSSPRSMPLTATPCCGGCRRRRSGKRASSVSRRSSRCLRGVRRSIRDHWIARIRFPHSLEMSPITRRVLQAVLYEVIAIAVVGPLLGFAFDKPQASTFGLAVVLSTIALAWNYVFNWMFERWESRQTVRGRSFARRLAHGAGFEGGLGVFLVPVMSLWLEISLAAALVADLVLLVFFFFYAI